MKEVFYAKRNLAEDLPNRKRDIDLFIPHDAARKKKDS